MSKLDMPRVLLVEDNELNRNMLSRRLARKGWEVLVAADGREGVESAGRCLPDVVLMDLDLPDIDGWSATRMLKAGERTRNIPIIAVTAHAMAGDRERALEAGCDHFAAKPIEFAALVESMEAILKEKQCR